MRASLSSIALILGLATITTALCPYVEQMAKRGAVPNNQHAQDQGKHGRHQPRSTITSLPADKKGIFLMNRIAPGTSQLYLSNADGTNERPLLSDPIYEYHASFSPDGHWITFTGERNGDGNSDIYRVRTNGSDLQELVGTPSVEDGAVMSPDGRHVAYVSTANGYRANIWVVDVDSGKRWNVTDTPQTPWANASLPNGYFRPSWSSDGKWLAFSSDRNTGWYGHGDQTFLGQTGWEHTQELSIYAVRPNGSDFRQVATRKGNGGWSLGSPKWSKDGKRVIFYEMTREATWDSHRPESITSANSSIVSVDFATSKDRRSEVQGKGVKLFPQFIDNNKTVGYFYKGGTNEGIYTTAGSGTYINTTSATVRSPSWSPDGKTIIYEKTTWTTRPMEKKLYSWDTDWEYRFTDVFPQLSNQNVLAITQKQLGNSSVASMKPDNGTEHLVFNDLKTDFVDSSMVSQGLAGAFQPSWSGDGEWITVGVGFWFQSRSESGGWLVRAASNGSTYEVLTDSASTLNSSTINSGFPSFSPSGEQIVYRVWGTNSTSGDESQLGLRLLDLRTRTTKTLTTKWDNLPFFSPNGTHIVFTRKTSPTNYDVCTMASDGSDIRVLTSSGANDAHAVWSADGERILYSTGMFGFQYECALYDQTFQPYGQVVSMDARDGGDKRVLTDSIWEDSMPLFVTREALGGV